MQAVMNLPHTDQWNIAPMKMTDIPMVVSWMNALAPQTKIDTDQIIVQIKGELELARKTDFPEYFIGYLKNQAVSFITGYFIKANKPYPGNRISMKDYKVSILFNPLLNTTDDLFLPTWHQALKFLFERKDIGRVLVAFQEFDFSQIEAIKRLWFMPMKSRNHTGPNFQYFACRRIDFFNLVSI